MSRIEEIGKITDPGKRMEALQAYATQLEAAQAPVGQATLEAYTNPKTGKTSLSMTIPGTFPSVNGGRRKWASISEAVKSGRVEAFLKAHPEVRE